jgi:Predicted dehydrogenases and related proteins
MQLESIIDLDYKPKLPKDKSIGIAIVGAGEIVQSSHLPAYKMADFNVIGIYDIDTKKAQQVTESYQLKNCFQSLEELLEHPDVLVVDIAVPAKFQPEIVKKVVRKGKHVLCQKPLAETMEEAHEIYSAVLEAGVKGAVNQQMRWAPGIRASHAIINRGWLGELVQASIQVNVFTDWESWRWLTEIDKLEVMYHSIHYLDSIRFLFGTPEYIYADGAKFPNQKAKGETRTLIHMKFPGDTRGLIHDNHNNWAGEDDWYATFRFEGTEGVIKGTNGALYNYPIGREDTITFKSKKLEPNYWFTPKLEGKWFPHAFMGTMGELLRAIEEDRKPENSIEDNLITLRMLFATYQSMKEKRPVWLEEIK